MKIQDNILRIKFYLRLGLVFFVFWLIIDLTTSPHSFGAMFINSIWLTIYLTVLNYFFFEYTLPFIRKKRRSIFFNILLGVLLILMQIMLYSFGFYGWRGIGIGLHIYTPIIVYESVEKGVGHFFPHGLLSLFFFGVVKHYYDYQKLKLATQTLLIEKQEAELNYLKSQTNPHFLFNTLNNIYSLSKDKSDLAPESIVRLSKILRFMLYEAGGEYIAIEQEIKIINDYIALEKLRYDESLHINFNYDVENLKQALPPLLLMPLVENAFKHGASETRHQPFVDIHLSVNNRQLQLLVKNSTEDVEENYKVKENIGLSNLRRQLELLYADYKLSVQQTDSIFIANLKINLATHVHNQVYNRRG
jgi:sensor histidine kinase YesM